jgi:hypothetical protein
MMNIQQNDKENDESSLARKTSKALDAIIKAHNWMEKKKKFKRKQLE